MIASPYLMGLLDAIEQGGYLEMGMTWEDDQDANDAYDRGANMGELLMHPLNALRDLFAALGAVARPYLP